MIGTEAGIVGRLLALRDLQGIGDKRVVKLVERFGSVNQVYRASDEELLELHYVDEQNLRAIRDLDSVATVYADRIARTRDGGDEVVTILDDAYPEALREFHAPLIIFARGNLSLLESPSVSFAGSRDATEETLSWVREVSSELAANEKTIVSGGALGVDTAAHEGALEATGRTIAILPSGFDSVYPDENAELFARIAKEGLLLSHKFPDESSSRSDFLYRNQTNSGLSEQIVIAAAGESGGTMSQYKNARSQEKQVLIPRTSVGASPIAGIDSIREEQGVTEVSTAEDVLAVRIDEGRQSSLSSW